MTEADVEPITWEAAVRKLREQPDQQALVHACFYDDPLLQAAQRYHASSEWEAVRRLIGKASGRALDVGAGRGIASYAFARDGWAVTALEPDPSKIVGAGAIRALSDEAHVTIDIVETWGEQLPFADGSFDVVHCRQVLHHARDLVQLCREVARVLTPGGLFLATREHVISKPSDLQAFLDSHPLHRLYGGEHAYTLGDYRSAIESSRIVLHQVLNPYETDINTYPESLDAIKQRWAKKLGLPFLAGVIPDAALAWMGERSAVPGRLYTFVGRKE